MSTAAAAAAAADATPAAKPRRKKKMLVILLALVVVLAAAGGGAWFFLKKPVTLDEDGEPVETAHQEEKEKDKRPPVFMPLDTMVVNLADPGGERFAQVGITLEVAEDKSVEKIKAYLPSIRSAVLILISQRTAAELLQREGKEKLAQDIRTEAGRPFVAKAAKPAKEAKAAKEAKDGKEPKTGKASARPEPADTGPVVGVLFSSFIVQ